MDSNSQAYLTFFKEPSKGLQELYKKAQTDILKEFEEKLNNGITDKSLFDGLLNFYIKTPLFEFNGMHYELTTFILDVITDFETKNNVLVDKEALYFFRALCQVTSSNTIGAMANLELANKERIRISGANITTDEIISNLPEKTVYNPMASGYIENPLVVSLSAKYPALVKNDFKDIISQLAGIDAISLLSSGLRNVQVSRLIKKYDNSLMINRMFAQEIINSLCILNESIIKDYPEVSATITNKKRRQIGAMLSPQTLGVINVNVSRILGNSTAGYSGLYNSIPLLDEIRFDTEYPIYLNDLETNKYTEDEFKARVLLGIHSLRNKVLHDYDDTLIYYTDADLFLKTIGLLFVGVNVTKNLK